MWNRKVCTRNLLLTSVSKPEGSNKKKLKNNFYFLSDQSKLFVPYKTTLLFPLFLSSIGAGNVLCSSAWPTILKLLVFFTWSHLAW